MKTIGKKGQEQNIHNITQEHVGIEVFNFA